MKGSYPIKVFNRRVQYKFTINRNLTILRGGQRHRENYLD